MQKTIIGIIILIGIASLTLLFASSADKAGALDEFAQCLREKQITMYGAEWCPHCQNEKKAFGSSFQFVPYVECPNEPQKCLGLKIKSYPTWILPSERRLEGEQGLAKLSQESGCALPDSTVK
jgi:glutaredoxin